MDASLISDTSTDPPTGLLTIIVTCSFIPSHPSIHIIKETLESLSLLGNISNTKIILAHDYNDNINYHLYLENLREYVKDNSNIEIVVRSTHGHLTGNVRNAISHVTTKYVLVIQHDLPFIEPVDIYKVIEDIEENPQLKHIRFNKRRNILAGFDSIKSEIFGLQRIQKNFIYTRTPGWSDQNHLCLTSYYNDLILKECKDGNFMEKTMQYKATRSDYSHDRYGTYIFGPLNHNAMIKHTNGRKSQ